VIDITEAALAVNGWKVQKCQPNQAQETPDSPRRVVEHWMIYGPDGTSFGGPPEMCLERAVAHDKGLCWFGWSVAKNVGGLVARKRRADGALFERVATTIELLASHVASWEAAQA
jgi:hypothetical protein